MLSFPKSILHYKASLSFHYSDCEPGCGPGHGLSSERRESTRIDATVGTADALEMLLMP